MKGSRIRRLLDQRSHFGRRTVDTSVIYRQIGKGGEIYPELCHEKSNVLIEGVEDNLSDSLVAPGAVNKEKFAKITELCNCNIGASGSLETLNATDTDAYMCGLDHRDIVRPITDSQKKRLEMTLHELNHKRFL